MNSIKGATKRVLAALLVLPVVLGGLIINAQGMAANGEQDGPVYVEQTEGTIDHERDSAELSKNEGENEGGASPSANGDTTEDENVNPDDKAKATAEGPQGEPDPGEGATQEEPEEEPVIEGPMKASGFGFTDAVGGGLQVNSLRLYQGSIDDSNEVTDGDIVKNNTVLHFVVDWELLPGSDVYDAHSLFTVELPTGFRYTTSSLVTLNDNVSGEELGKWRVVGGSTPHIEFTLTADDVYGLTNGRFVFSGVLEVSDSTTELVVDVGGQIITIRPDIVDGWATKPGSFEMLNKIGRNSGGVVSWNIHYNYDVAYNYAIGSISPGSGRYHNVFIVDELGDGMAFTGEPYLYYYFTRPVDATGLPGSAGEPLFSYSLSLSALTKVTQNNGESNDDFVERLRGSNVPCYGITDDGRIACFYFGEILDIWSFTEAELRAAMTRNGISNIEIIKTIATTYGENNKAGGKVPAVSINLKAEVLDGGDADYTNAATVYYGNNTIADEEAQDTVYVEKLDGSATRVEPDEVLLEKQDSVSLKPIEGARFLLQKWENGGWETYTRDHADGTYTTDDKGHILVSRLFDGQYRFTEVAVAPGYEADTIEWYGASRDGTFAINTSESKGPTLTAYNTASKEPLPGNVTVRKIDSVSSSTVLENAEFRLYRIEDDLSETDLGAKTTDADGLVSWSGLVAGNYKLVETVAPLGYVLPAGENAVTYFELRDTGSDDDLVLYSSEGVRQGSNVLSLRNTKATEPTGSITVHKVDAGNNDTTLSGAVFQLYRQENGSYTAYGTALTTDGNGEATWSLLPAGSYRLVEQRAPSGYVLPGGTAAQLDFELRMADGALALFIGGTQQGSMVITRANSRSTGGSGGGGRGSGSTSVRTDTTNPFATITDGEVPLGDLPGEDLVSIEDEETPLGDNPYTGVDLRTKTLGQGLLVVSLLTIGGLSIARKRREDREK